MPRLWAVAVLFATALGAAAPAAAQTAALNRELLKDWVELKAAMLTLAEAMPGWSSTCG